MGISRIGKKMDNGLKSTKCDRASLEKSANAVS